MDLPLTRAAAQAERGQALPLVLGVAVAAIMAALVLVVLGAATAGASRLQAVADLAAVSAARSLRDDHPRLHLPARLPGGTPNPRRLVPAAYRARAIEAARIAARRNGMSPGSVRVAFPGGGAAPTRVRVRVAGMLRLPERIARGSGDEGPRAVVSAVAAAFVETGAAPAAPEMASGGGYEGPLAYRGGEPMRPDVAAAFDRMSASAARAGLTLLVNSGFRSDAEQAVLFAANPDPRWVAPPGTSLHRCATELDIGPASAYAWLAANAPRFGFVQRYSWEPWHYGFTAGPAPCSAAGNALADRPDPAEPAGLPAYVPARYRVAIAEASARWNVPAALLAAQLQAESGFDPGAVSPAGAQGIAQFMPATAAAYGLRDPFDPDAAIAAQARLMAALLRQFGSTELALAAYNAGPGAVSACSCVPPYPETQAYVARIMGLLSGAGVAPPPELEVRLVA